MDNEKFTKAYHESRNGANHFVRHWFVKSFQYSDGVEDCAEAGCFWLLDIAATEMAPAIRKARETLGSLTVKAANGKADLILTGSGDCVIWTRHVNGTDMAPGEWVFHIADEGHRYAMILPSEY